MAAKKSQKPQKSKPAPAATKPTLIALKPLKKPEETQPESSTEVVEPPAPVEPEPPVPAVEPTRSLKPTKPIKRIKPSPVSGVEEDSSLPENSNAIFQAVGIIVGEVTFSDKKAHVTIGDKTYPLYYASSHKKAYEALKIHIKKTGQSQQRLIVYPRVMHFPKKEQPYLMAFQLIGFHSERSASESPKPEQDSSTIDQELQDFEFKLSGLWQFIPVCQIPCITVMKNFTSERLDHIKEASVEEKVRFMKASHLPVLWRDAPVRPFRFNPKLDKEQQGQASFVEIKVRFLTDRDVFEFCELRSRPSQTPPKFLKAGKKDKAEALRNQRQRG